MVVTDLDNLSEAISINIGAHRHMLDCISIPRGWRYYTQKGGVAAWAHAGRDIPVMATHADTFYGAIHAKAVL